MDTEVRIKVLSQLGKVLKNDLEQGRLDKTFKKAYIRNNWFTTDNSRLALNAIIGEFLDENQLRKWAEKYSLDQDSPKKAGLVMAGNIPMAGFHDLLAVLMAGHIAQIKFSSKDETILPDILDTLYEIEPAFKKQVETPDFLSGFDAIIATGSNNSSRYFEYYFGKYPHIIRNNRNSAAIITGEETKDDLKALGSDVFSYFGLGCRNVSKVFVPQDYDFTPLFEAFEDFKPIIDHNKYKNNYDYHKSRLLVNKEHHYDTGFLLVEEQNDAIASPISTLFYERVSNPEQAFAKIAEKRDEIQCIASKEASGNKDMPVVSPGQTQFPGLFDFPDNVDTLKFLTERL